MTRTTIMADERVLERLRELARGQGRSFADVVREALERHVERPVTRLEFIASGASEDALPDAGRSAGDTPFEPRSWR